MASGDSFSGGQAIRSRADVRCVPAQCFVDATRASVSCFSGNQLELEVIDDTLLFASRASPATLTLALSTAAGAATVRLVPLSAPSVATSVTCAAVPASISNAAPAELPTIAAEQNVTGITAVRIDIDAAGRLRTSSLLASSGNRWIDQAALRAARTSRYSAETRDCAPVGGAYAFVVDFTQVVIERGRPHRRNGHARSNAARGSLHRRLARTALDRRGGARRARRGDRRPARDDDDRRRARQRRRRRDRGRRARGRDRAGQPARSRPRAVLRRARLAAHRRLRPRQLARVVRAADRRGQDARDDDDERHAGAGRCRGRQDRCAPSRW